MPDYKFHYVVSYDFSTEHADVEVKFLDLLKATLTITQIGKSVYSIVDDMGKQMMERCILALMNKAFDENNKKPNDGDRAYLLCNSQKVNCKVKDPESHKIYCYKLL